MVHLVLGLVLLAGTLAAGNPLHRRDLKSIQEMVLDMAPNSFDDQYRGCSHMMEKELKELNRTEFARNSIYADTWAIATKEWQSWRHRSPQSLALRPEQAIALLAYTQAGPLYPEFNKAVREAGRSRREYLDNFHFKTLHFLLTEALHSLQDARPPQCYHVFRGVKGIRFTTQQGQIIRFGYFASSSLQLEKSKRFGEDTVFKVNTCYGVPITDFSFFREEEEVLIPPFETFKVINVTYNGSRPVIQLSHLNATSNYNCEFVKGDIPAGWSFRRSVARDPPHLWVLLLAAAALAAAGSA
ncbi:NARE ribosyltransferase, partial [Chionis minor]|nr:NARE ribosyltransferase [Chionis minor]